MEPPKTNYKHAVTASNKLARDVDVKPIVAAHIIEELLDTEILTLLNGIDESAHQFDKHAQIYIKEHSFVNDGMTAYPFTPNKMFIQRTKSGSMLNLKIINFRLQSRNTKWRFKSLFEVIGFLWFEKPREVGVQEQRDEQTRNKGVKCTSLNEYSYHQNDRSNR